MVAFASNSLLNRLALGQRSIDATSYTTIRLASGAVTLFAIAYLQRKNNRAFLRGSWTSAALLFIYAISFAYLSLSAGTGALILFGSVQATMILVAVRSREHPNPLEWIGLLFALGGLVYLVSPGLAAPSPLGSVLMTVAGIAWGFYTMRGRGSENPLGDTAGNFVYSLPMALAVLLPAWRSVSVSTSGVLYAAISGALASGVGHVIWYAALRGLTSTRAAVVQLSAPVIAAWGGVVLLAESVSARLVIAGAFLSGIALAVTSHTKKA